MEAKEAMKVLLLKLKIKSLGGLNFFLGGWGGTGD
jgi:hypothetical protein